MTRTFLTHSSVLFLTGVVLGCGGGATERTDISGKATFDGKPIVYGQIDFIPDTAKGHVGVAGTATIVNGQYDTAEEGGMGIVPGAHEVKVTAYPEKPPVNEDETKVVEGPKPLFVGYVLKLDVSAPTLDVSVPKEAEGFSSFGSSAPKRSANEP